MGEIGAQRPPIRDAKAPEDRSRLKVEEIEKLARETRIASRLRAKMAKVEHFMARSAKPRFDLPQRLHSRFTPLEASLHALSTARMGVNFIAKSAALPDNVALEPEKRVDRTLTTFGDR
jgi:hypothetical protein